MKVRVYFNLRTHLWSVRACEGPQRGKVIAHERSVTLRDCRFIVSEASRQRVLRDKVRSVHAMVEGTLIPTECPTRAAVRFTYNPYRAAHFHIAGKVDAKVSTASRVYFAADGAAYFTA